MLVESIDTPDEDRGDGIREVSSRFFFSVPEEESTYVDRSNDGGGVRDLWNF